MPKLLRNVLILGIVVAAVGIAAFAYITRPLEEASEDIQENTQQLETETEDAVVFRISQENSQVSYTIEEELRGLPKTVVGVTNEVAGDILVDFGQVSATTVGQIRINARTFATDDERRDNTVGRQVLDAEDHEFIEFLPSAITGLPESVELGETITFDITGDLTVAGNTQSVTFTATATYAEETQLTGNAEATIEYADWGIRVPSVPFVANVQDTLILRIDFVADRVDDAESA